MPSIFHEKMFVYQLHPLTFLGGMCMHLVLQMADMFASINMTFTTTKSVFELEGKIMLISYSNEIWEIWTTLCDVHNAGDLVNPKI